jgi:Cu(I)/Ag(I) efflux system periplasmic protein CusF
MSYRKSLSQAAGLVGLLSAAAMSPAWAASHQGGHGAHGDHGKPMAQAATGEMTAGEVRKVDKEGGKLTLKHADIKSLDMPAMTMVFAVRDKAMLDKLKAGDKIKFKAVNDSGKYTVTELQMAP